METVCQVSNFAALFEVLKADREGCPDQNEVEPSAVEVKPYAFDDRTGWNTHIVTIAGSPVGFTDGLIERNS
jgi:hypothetical protein